MDRVLVSDDFHLDEFIPKALYESKASWKLLYLLDNRIINVAQFLRNRYGAATINNWAVGGDRNCSGFRYYSEECKQYYSLTSQHSHGRAVDIIFKNISAAEIRKDIKEHNHLKDMLLNLGARRIEDGVSWLHIDAANTNYFTFF